MFSVCFVFKRFFLVFKVEVISYVILYLTACCICCLHIYSAYGSILLHDYT